MTCYNIFSMINVLEYLEERAASAQLARLVHWEAGNSGNSITEPSRSRNRLAFSLNSCIDETKLFFFNVENPTVSNTDRVLLNTFIYTVCPKRVVHSYIK